MKKNFGFWGFVAIGLLVFLSFACASTKLYYYETDNTTPSDERCIIGLIDNEGGVLNVVTIDGKEVDLGGGFTANKSFMMKSGNHSIVMDWVSSSGNFRGSLAKGIKVEGSFMPKKVYLFVPRSNIVKTADGKWESLTPTLQYYNTTAYKIYIEIYDAARLDEYQLSSMDKNHFTKIYQSIMEVENKNQ
jgi:hypothetical protein